MADGPKSDARFQNGTSEGAESGIIGWVTDLPGGDPVSTKRVPPGGDAEKGRIKQILTELLPEILPELLPKLLHGTVPEDPANVFLSESQVEARWGAKKGYCAELRAQGIGPKFVRLSPRMVRYRPPDLLKYENDRTFASNAEELVRANEPEEAPIEPAHRHKRSGKTAETV
jgi:hypothetical protein